MGNDEARVIIRSHTTTETMKAQEGATGKLRKGENLFFQGVAEAGTMIQRSIGWRGGEEKTQTKEQPRGRCTVSSRNQGKDTVADSCEAETEAPVLRWAPPRGVTYGCDGALEGASRWLIQSSV